MRVPCTIEDGKANNPFYDLRVLVLHSTEKEVNTMSANKEEINLKKRKADEIIVDQQQRQPAAPNDGGGQQHNIQQYETPSDQTFKGLGCANVQAVPVVGCQSSGELAAVAAPAMTPGQTGFKMLFKEKNKTPPTSFPRGSPPDMALIQPIMDFYGFAQHKVTLRSVDHLMILFLYVRGVPQSIEDAAEKNKLFTSILVRGLRSGSGCRKS
jgi:hypothetical protein